MTDQKIKQASGKVPLNLVPLGALKGCARVFGYGARKYAAGNYYTADDEELCNRYAGGILRHLSSSQNPNGLFDFASLAALDDESGLPEIDHMLCGLIMLRALLAKHGALPLDPGVGNDPPDTRSTEQKLADARVAAGAFDVVGQDGAIVQDVADGAPSFGRNQMPAEMVPALAAQAVELRAMFKPGDQVRVVSDSDGFREAGDVGRVRTVDPSVPYLVTFADDDHEGQSSNWFTADELEAV